MAITETTDIVTIPGKIIKKFTTDLAPSTVQAQDTTTWVCPSGVKSVRYLVVAGGGSGGLYKAGGGSGVAILQYSPELVLVREHQTPVTGSGNLMVMEVCP